MYGDETYHEKISETIQKYCSHAVYDSYAQQHEWLFVCCQCKCSGKQRIND